MLNAWATYIVVFFESYVLLLQHLSSNWVGFVLFDLILYVTSTIFQLNRDVSSWVEQVLSLDKCVLLKDHNAVTPVRLEPAAESVGGANSGRQGCL